MADHVAWQLASIQSDYMRDRFSALNYGKSRNGVKEMYGRSDVVAALKTAAAKRKGDERHVEEWATLWLINRMLGDGVTPTIRSQLFALAVGGSKVPDPSQITKRLAAVEEKIRASRRGIAVAA